MMIINYIIIFVFLLFIPKISYFFRKCPSIWNKNKKLTWFQCLVYIGINDFIKIWHDYEIHGLEELQTIHTNNTLLVGYHSRCTIDLLYLFCIIQPNLLVSYLLFNIPVLKSILPLFHIISSKSNKHDQTEINFVSTLMNSNGPLLLLPGGIYECLKPYHKRYQLQWKNIPGFVRVIYESKDFLGENTKVIPFYTRNCEKCYYNNEYIYDTFGNYGNKLYQSFKKGNILILPFMLTTIIISIGFIILPKRIKLDTYFGNPIILNKNESSEMFAKRIHNETQELINNIQFNENINKSNKVNINNKRLFNYIKVFILGIYTILQNIFITILLLLLIWLPFPLLLLFTFIQYIYNHMKYFSHTTSERS